MSWLVQGKLGSLLARLHQKGRELLVTQRELQKRPSMSITVRVGMSRVEGRMR
jgi:hypothetical protein